eukprot:4787988-Amphidinium_carterae.1
MANLKPVLNGQSSMPAKTAPLITLIRPISSKLNRNTHVRKDLIDLLKSQNRHADTNDCPMPRHSVTSTKPAAETTTART